MIIYIPQLILGSRIPYNISLLDDYNPQHIRILPKRYIHQQRYLAATHTWASPMDRAPSDIAARQRVAAQAHLEAENFGH